MLRADLLTLAALEAAGRPAPRRGVDGIVVIIRVPVVVEALGVHGREQVGDGDVLRAAVRAVAAGRAGDEVLAAEDPLHLLHRGQLLGAERAEVLHEGDVVLHLLHIAHAGEDHQHSGEARREAPIFIVEKSADMRYNKLLNFSGVTGDYGELVLDGEAVFYEGRHYWLFPRDSKR